MNHPDGHDKAAYPLARQLARRLRAVIEDEKQSIEIRQLTMEALQAWQAADKTRGIEHSRYRSLMDAVPDPVTILDWSGTVLDFNRAGYKMPNNISLATGRVVSNQVIGINNREKHLFRWLSVSAIPKYHANSSSPEHTFSLIRDITDLKRETAMFSRVQSLAAVGAWEFNRQSGQLYLRSGAMRLLNAADADARLEDMLHCFAQPYRDQMRTALGSPNQPFHAFRFKLRCMPSNHGAEWVQIQGDIDPLDPSGDRITGTIADISERKDVEARLRQQTLTNPITGLFNREAIIGEIEFRLAESRLDFAILYIDLDRLKLINDVLGHHVGDQLLRMVADRMQTGIGDRAVLARLGGDEFLALCPQHTATSAIPIAEQVINALSRPFVLNNEEYLISASIGIAQAGIDGDEASILIQNADAAMYDSKRRSFNGWQCYSENLAHRQRDRLRIDTLLRNAINNDEMRLEYQPQIDLASGTIVGAEALMRWENPTLGTMPPNIFIHHAEDSGEVVRLGNWALHQVCQQIRLWRDAGLDVMPVAVNVSFRQFLVGDLASTIAQALDDAGIPGCMLELEFTERVLIEDEPETLRTIARLRELGVSLSIDDFGEGYSALNYLRRLPIHGLKLSQLFLQGVPENRSDVAVCQAVVGIASSLGLNLVAEGVETAAQRDFLLSLGVPVAQGFLFSRPLPAEDFGDRLATAHVFGRGAA